MHNILCVAALVLGMLSGGFIAWKRDQPRLQLLHQLGAMCARGELDQDQNVPQLLRTGDTNVAIDLLDTDVDAQMMVLEDLSKIPKKQRVKPDIQALQRARKYRQAHPMEIAPQAHADEGQ